MKISHSQRVLLLIVFLLLAISSCRNRLTLSREEPIIGVKIYNYEGTLDSLFQDLHSLGINTVFTSVKLDVDPYFRKLARKYHILRFLILPIFYNPEVLAQHPNWYAITQNGQKASDDWVQFVCPSQSEYRKSKIEFIKKIVKEHNPDGISIDFIRHFVYWEKVYPTASIDSLPNTCFDDRCMKKFQNDTHIKMPAFLKTAEEKYTWIKKNNFSRWVDWKCNLITSMLKSITTEARKIKPELLINIHIVPWRENDFGGAIKIIAGQDVSAMANYTDYISPMTYHYMVKQKPAWIHEVVDDIAAQANRPVVPSIQVKEEYLSGKLTLEDFKEAVKQAVRCPSKGIIFYNWESLSSETEKKIWLKTFLKRYKKLQEYK